MGVYLDHNATSPASPAHLAALFARFDQVAGNPSSPHTAGRAASVALTESRKNVAASIGCEPSEVVFVSGGSEANNLATKGVLRAFGAKMDALHAVTSAVEHPCVLEPLRFLAEHHGLNLTILPVNSEGRISLVDLMQSLRPNTALVSIMAANNETGAVQPMREFADWLHSVRWTKLKPGQAWRDLLQAQGNSWASHLADDVDQSHLQKLHLHVDAVQAWGKLKPDQWCSPGFDSISLCAHKVGGVAGIGALILKRGRKFEPLVQGGAQERSRRAGTENILGILSLGMVAQKISGSEWWTSIESMELLRNNLRSALQSLEFVSFNSPEQGCLPNTLNICVHSPRLKGEDVLMELDLRGFFISSGSACSSGANRPSQVLLALGRTAEEARNGLRFSLSPDTTSAEISALCTALRDIFSKR